MKEIFIFLFFSSLNFAISAQTLLPSTSKPFTNNASSNSVNNSSGTPMVKDPVANNNPSYQAAIPINNQVNSLEASTPLKQVPSNQVIVKSENVPVVIPTGPVVITNNNSVVPVTAVNAVKGDTLYNSLSSVTPVQSTVIYNKETGVDVQKKNSLQVSSNSNNSRNTPLLQTYVSESVVNKFKLIYGDSLYDIRVIRSGDKQVNYIVRIKENGYYQSIYINEDGSRVKQ